MAGVLVLSALNELGESNWPERWPTEALLERQRLNPISFASQYLMQPVSMSDNPLKLEYLRFVIDIPFLNYFIGVDPSPTGRTGTDYFALAVIGLAENSQRYLIEAHRLQIDPLEQANFIRQKALHYRAQVVLIEAYSAQKLFTRYFFNEGPRINIREAKGTNIPKAVRYASMVPSFTSGKVIIKGEYNDKGEIVPAQSVAPFVTEWTQWNDMSNRDDVLDAVGKAMEASGLSPEFIPGISVSASPSKVSQSGSPGSLAVGRREDLSIRERPAIMGTIRQNYRRGM